MKHDESTMSNEGDAASARRPLPAIVAVYPLALLLAAAIYDVVGLASRSATWFTVSFWTILPGAVGGLIAAALRPGDWLGVPRGSRARSLALRGRLVDVLIIALFLLSWILRCQTPEAPPSIALMLSFSGSALAFLGRG